MAGLVRQDVALSWHLQSNHYPPLPQALIPACQQAIKNANAGLWDAWVPLPPGYGFVSGVTTAQLVEGCHLDSFLEIEDED